jgi:hypothetical protein
MVAKRTAIDVSFWFAVLSPLFGIVIGFVALILIYR